MIIDVHNTEAIYVGFRTIALRLSAEWLDALIPMILLMARNQDDESESAGTAKEFSREYSEEGLATLLIVVGAILFVFPEPITSFAGAVLVVVGVIVWATDWLWG